MHQTNGRRRAGNFVAQTAFVLFAMMTALVWAPFGLDGLVGPGSLHAQVVISGSGDGATESGLTEAEKEALAGNLTETERDDLLARLSDSDVRELLLYQLDQLSRKQAEAASDHEGFIQKLEASAHKIRKNFVLTMAELENLPTVIPFALERLSAGNEPGFLWLFLLGLAVIFVAAAAAEWLFRRATTSIREKLRDGQVADYRSKAVYVLLRFFYEAVARTVFLIVALVVFFALYQGGELTRATVMTYLGATLIVLGVESVARLLLAPASAKLRLVPLNDHTAVAFHRCAVWFSVVVSFGVLSCQLVLSMGLEQRLHDLLQMMVGLVAVSLLIVMVWRGRRDVGRVIRGFDEDVEVGRWRGILAQSWSGLAILYILFVYFMSLFSRLSGEDLWVGAGIGSLVIVIAVPLLDAVAGYFLTLLFDSDPYATPETREAKPEETLTEIPTEGPAQAPVEVPPATVMAVDETAEFDEDFGPEISPYYPMLRRVIRFILILIGIVFFAHIWGIPLFSFAQSDFGAVIMRTVLDIGFTLLIAYICWEVAKAAIDRHLADEGGMPVQAELGGEGGGQGASRLMTLLPLLKRFLQVTLIVMAAMIILSSFGVDIGPLIAGAGVIGIAIGFGAQTLVRDIVSGVFFLLDDAFRMGEYVDIGDVKGTVEAINLRSLVLRHHRGPLHTVPFGEIQYLTNYSRDWVIMKLQFRVTYDTDVNKVKKIFKRLGQELMDDEILGPKFIEPLKSQGVLAMEDSAMILRAKFMAVPGEQFMIRKEVYTRVQQAFHENGIKFAHRRVTVDLPPQIDPESEQGKSIAEAAAAAADQQTGGQGTGGPATSSA
ncbi:MAG: mechanosensitive ion channel family protein [Pseudomonadota bacterium]